MQETRLWDVARGRTAPMRSKEEAHDYRYFPDPDLPPLVVEPEWVAEARASVPELPEARKRRFVSQYGLPERDAAPLAEEQAMAAFYEATASASGNPKAAANWIMGELTRKLKQLGVGIGQAGVTPGALGSLIRLVDAGTIGGAVAKSVFDRMYGSGRSPEAIVAEEGLSRIGDSDALAGIVRRTLADNRAAADKYRSGKTGALGYLVGQVMRATRGQADPRVVGTLLRAELDDSPAE